MTKDIVIVGAGVIGLSVAYQLITEHNYPSPKIKIVSQDFPSTGLLNPHYTSSKSGAHFRPFPSKSDAELRDSKLARPTYHFFKKLARPHPESSVKWIDGYDFIERDDELYETLAPVQDLDH
ncbi:unnamed protein product [Ambrosiozyma monospora]|uniref:Unnamed protein product n=1 Tax=Ambrosiozyma monospora TaxID=43982 RepID=A0ACB5UCY5_AMBMO|nr:unnamed protein product [Ambrosiozyma monospora]